MVGSGRSNMKTSRAAAGRLGYAAPNMQLTAELLSGQLAVRSETSVLTALSAFQQDNITLIDEAYDKSAGKGGEDTGSSGSDGPDRGPASNKSLPQGVKPVTTFGSKVVREILGFEGGIGGIGDRSGPSDHPSGYAIDVMVGTNKEHGDQIADFFYHNREVLRVKYIIWYEKIASSKENWKWRPYTRYASQPSNDTLQHRDHPHISFERVDAPTTNDKLYWPSGRQAMWPGQTPAANPNAPMGNIGGI